MPTDRQHEQDLGYCAARQRPPSVLSAFDLDIDTLAINVSGVSFSDSASAVQQDARSSP
jgi:hypothetical protein